MAGRRYFVAGVSQPTRALRSHFKKRKKKLGEQEVGGLCGETALGQAVASLSVLSLSPGLVAVERPRDAQVWVCQGVGTPWQGRWQRGSLRGETRAASRCSPLLFWLKFWNESALGYFLHLLVALMRFRWCPLLVLLRPRLLH